MEGEVTTSTENAIPTEQPTNTTEQTTQEQPVTQTIETQTSEKPAGFDPVDVNTATPQEIDARIRQLYQNMKRYEGAAKKVPELQQANELLINEINQLKDHQSKIVNHLQVSDFQDAEQQLKAQRQAAWAASNPQAYDEANDKLRDLSVRRALAEMNGQKPQSQQQTQQQLRPVSGEAVIDLAVQRGAVTQDEASVYKAWMNEIDDSGNTKRPWVNEGDARNVAAASEGRAVFNNPTYAHLTFAQKLQEIDKRMGIRMPQPQGQNVLPNGNLTAPRKNNNVKLSDDERRIAIRTKFGSKQGAKSETDYAEFYRQAKIKSQQKGASR